MSKKEINRQIEDIKRKIEIPSGLEHIKMVVELGDEARRSSASKLGNYKDELNVLGISLSILYQAGTCHRKCFGGSHVLESLAARTYNLACGAYTLICRGLYDEALNLVRSIGEISNLIALFYTDQKNIKLWLSYDNKTRRRKFSPFEVRESLKKTNERIMYADEDWYSKFCEDYVHVHPGMKPNVHNKQGLRFAGGFIQEEGLKFSIDELTNVCTHIAMFVSKYAHLDDLWEELNETLKAN